MHGPLVLHLHAGGQLGGSPRSTAIWATNSDGPLTTSSNAANGIATSISTQFQNLYHTKTFYMEPLLQPEGRRRRLGDQADQAAHDVAIILCAFCSWQAARACLVLAARADSQWLLRNQKEQARRRYQTWGSSVLARVLGVSIVMFAMLYGSIVSSSRCSSTPPLVLLAHLFA